MFPVKTKKIIGIQEEDFEGFVYNIKTDTDTYIANSVIVHNCDFVLVAAGNYEDLEKVHPALRSRIRGYGYELYMNLDMPDTKENREKIVQFVAQEVKKDGKIPQFSKKAVELIIFEAKRRAGRKNNLTLKLRDLGGLIRAAGDIAKEKGHKLVDEQDVFEAKTNAKTLEQQM
ncbi:AAA family ATPase, partial [Candidatus Micrarchaeota archaeon]|nr:AAA family ATPase [Candidatus Micrarchaeota archaeon]